MLPETLTDLLAEFIERFDSEHRQIDGFEKAAKVKDLTSSWEGVRITMGYLQKRAEFIASKCQQIITTICVEPYKGLEADLMSQIETHCGPVKRDAEWFLKGVIATRDESLRWLTMQGTKMQIDSEWERIVERINLDLKVFCAGYTASKLKNEGTEAPKQVFNVGTVYGPVGNISDSQVTVSNSSSDKKAPNDN